MKKKLTLFLIAFVLLNACEKTEQHVTEKMVVAVITNDSRAKVGTELHKVAEILLNDKK